MPIVKVCVSGEQAEAIKAYAVASCRSVSGLMLSAVIEKAVRTKKRDPEGKIIIIPEKTLQRPVSARRKESDRGQSEGKRI